MVLNFFHNFFHLYFFTFFRLNRLSFKLAFWSKLIVSKLIFWKNLIFFFKVTSSKNFSIPFVFKIASYRYNKIFFHISYFFLYSENFCFSPSGRFLYCSRSYCCFFSFFFFRKTLISYTPFCSLSLLFW